MTKGPDWEALVDAAIRAVTGRSLPPDTGFFDAGLTSAMLVAVHDRLRADTGHDAGVAVFFKYPTRRRLATFLSTQDSPHPAVPVRPADGWTPSARRDLRARLRGGARGS